MRERENKGNKVKTNLIVETLTEEEICQAVYKIKKKGIAWDFITHWIPKLMTEYSPREIYQVYKIIKLVN